MAKCEDYFFKVSLLLSAYGIVVFLILRNLLGNVTSYSATPEQKNMMDRIINQQANMMSVATTVLILSLVLAIAFNILQFKTARKRIYTTTLVTQVILLTIMSYLYFLTKTIVF